MEIQQSRDHWSEETSRQFIDFGRYMVPQRERQMAVIAALLADLPPAARLVELCCGEGLLAEALLEAYPGFSMLAFDGSTEMLERARQRLQRFGERFHCQPFELAAPDWRHLEQPVEAFVSSLAVHHLLGPEKQALFRDLWGMLKPGGVLVLADVLEVASLAGRRLAADEWDEEVRKLAFALDGDPAAYDFFVREGWNMHRYLDPEDIDKPSPLFDQLKWLEAAGFGQVEVNWLLAGHAIFSGRK